MLLPNDCVSRGTGPTQNYLNTLFIEYFLGSLQSNSMYLVPGGEKGSELASIYPNLLALVSQTKPPFDIYWIALLY